MENEQDIEIGDVESYRSDKLHLFNHQALVMESLRRCAESGSHEMKNGWFNEKKDRFGNVVKVYVEDTQEKFSETVAITASVMSCDFDDDAEKKIKALEEKLIAKRKELLAGQWKWWSTLNSLQRGKFEEKGMGVIQGMFNFNLVFYKTLVQIKVEIHRAIFKELNLLTKRIDFYQQEDFTG